MQLWILTLFVYLLHMAPGYGVRIWVNLTVHVIVLPVYLSLVCTNTGPLGMTDGSVTDNQITANSFWTYFEPWEGRLHSFSHWTGAVYTPWIQVDFLFNVVMKGIITQGSAYIGVNGWVTKLRIQTGHSVYSLKFVTDEGSTKPKVCSLSVGGVYL